MDNHDNKNVAWLLGMLALGGAAAALLVRHNKQAHFEHSFAEYMPIPLRPEEPEVEANETATFTFTDPFNSTTDASSLAERPDVRVFSRVEIAPSPLDPDTLTARYGRLVTSEFDISPVVMTEGGSTGTFTARNRRVRDEDKTFVFVITKGRNKMGVAAITVRRGRP
jgi:hypothetical protein